MRIVKIVGNFVLLLLKEASDGVDEGEASQRVVGSAAEHV